MRTPQNTFEAPIQHHPNMPPEKPLSKREQKRRAELETQITDTVGKAFVVVGHCVRVAAWHFYFTPGRKSHKRLKIWISPS